MSSEEVAQLAQAIHSHADALVESWSRGPDASHRMARMEDTFELLADPELTPRLEHLVSNFVRRDKAKRQQGSSPFGPATGNSAVDSPSHGYVHRPLQYDRNPAQPAGSVVTQIPIQTFSRPLEDRSVIMPTAITGTNSLTSSNGAAPAASKKHLPKSILAAVQRFEPSSPPPTNSTLTLHNQYHSLSPSENSRIGTDIPGIGPVSRNLVWAESNSRHTVTERTMGRTLQHPIVLEDGVDGSRKNLTSSPPRRVVHIPIERVNDSVGSTRIINTSKVETVQNTTVQNKNFMNSGPNGFSVPPVRASNGEKIVPIMLTDSITGGINDSLESEEERLFQALRSGSVISSPQTTISTATVTYDPLHSVRERSSSPLANSNSRIAFAKERIRQSQEHPLTQQRLELQKRLPSPSSSLAAAIALQQGKTRFQPSDHFEDDHHSGHNTYNKDQGRQSWVSSMLRFSNGASVADRVQLFEKYPSHIVNSHSATVASSSQTVLHTPPNVSSSSISPPVSQISSSPKPKSAVCPSVPKPDFSQGNDFGISPQPEIVSGETPHSFSIVNVSMAPSASAVSPILATSSAKQTPSTSTSSLAAPWRTVPIESSYQPDSSSSTKKAKQSSPAKTEIPAPAAPLTTRKISTSIPKSVSPSSGHIPAAPIPKFFHPDGKLMPATAIQTAVNLVRDAMVKYPPFINYTQMSQLLQEIGIPLYWKKPIWNYFGIHNEDLLEATRFITFYKALMAQCADDEARFLTILQPPDRRKPMPSSSLRGNSLSNEFHFANFRSMYVTMCDFIPMMQDIIDTHPGLGFLREAPEFHSRYVTTVISRIFYKVNRSWSGKITWTEMKRSNLLRVIKRLEEETDINTITEYFSYEHFYVIYCKFWELDKDHDLLIDKEDLQAHGDYVLSRRIIDRIFDGTVLRGWDVSSPIKSVPGKMTYSDFVWFLLSEEDKKTPTAIEYWFRCLDLDGDGILSLYELEYFYEEQQSRVESLHIEPIHFANIVCCMMDMLHCSTAGIRLKELKRNPQLASVIFNTLFNLDKYIEHEQRDPFSSASTSGNANANGEWQEGESDWDRYAAAEYESLIAEETPSDNLQDTPDYDDPDYFNLSIP